MISMDKKYRTRNGREVMLGCIADPSHNFLYPVLGWIFEGPVWRVGTSWDLQGRIHHHGVNNSDLVEIGPETTK